MTWFRVFKCFSVTGTNVTGTVGSKVGEVKPRLLRDEADGNMLGLCSGRQAKKFNIYSVAIKKHQKITTGVYDIMVFGSIIKW